MNTAPDFLSNAVGALFVVAFVSVAIMLAVGLVDDAKTRFWRWVCRHQCGCATCKWEARR